MFSRRSSVATNGDSPTTATHEHARSPSAVSRKSSIGSHHSGLSKWSRATSVKGGTPTPSRSASVDLSGLDGPGGRDPWRGHPGHLSDEQQLKLAELKTTLTANGIHDEHGPAANAEGNGKGVIPEGTLLRFLRARKFDVAGAAKQYEEFVRWRRDKGIDEKFEAYDVEQFETLRAVYPMWTGRRDTRGMPIYVYKISALTPSKLSTLIPDDATSESAISVITFVLIRFLLPFCSSLAREREEVPVSGTSSIIDVGGVGLSRFWGLRSHLQVASQVASANFPETIDRVFVVGAPSFFPTVFNWAKKWFDPGTVEKIHILSSDPLERLLEYMPRANIPREYGGDLEWTYGEAPALGEVERAKLSDAPLDGPIAWDSEASKVVYLGTKDGKARDGAPHKPAGGQAVDNEFQTKPASTDDKPLMAAFIPSSDAPAGLVHATSSSSADAAADDAGPGAETPKHFANGTSPAHDPPHPPETGFVPGTHDPLTDERVRSRSLPPGEQGKEDAPPDAGASGQDERNEAVAKGWIPGSGISEQDFLKGVASLKL